MVEDDVLCACTTMTPEHHLWLLQKRKGERERGREREGERERGKEGEREGRGKERKGEKVREEERMRRCKTNSLLHALLHCYYGDIIAH